MANQLYNPSNSNITYPFAGTTTNHNTISYQKSTYVLMDEEITIEGYSDFQIAQTIALINCLGWKYYEEIRKQKVSFTEELKVILESKYKVYLRENKLDHILDN